jgi:hypothetical protein
MTNTTPHRATAEQWESLRDDDAIFAYEACILELRARVEALEAATAAPPQEPAPAGSLVELDASTDYIEEMRKLARRHGLGFLFNPAGGQFVNEEKRVNIQISTIDDEEDYFKLLNGLHCLGLEATATPPEPAPAGSLVERVADAIYTNGIGDGFVTEARAAIRAVAAAARLLYALNGQSVVTTWDGVAQWLEQEVEQ